MTRIKAMTRGDARAKCLERKWIGVKKLVPGRAKWIRTWWEKKRNKRAYSVPVGEQGLGLCREDQSYDREWCILSWREQSPSGGK